MALCVNYDFMCMNYELMCMNYDIMFMNYVLSILPLYLDAEYAHRAFKTGTL